jgi:hypothetical protein
VALKPVPSESHKVLRRPAEGMVKLNTNGAFMVYTAHARIGVIADDMMGLPYFCPAIR